MRYGQPTTPLAPHAYMHDLVVPASYVIVRPVRGHSTIFRIRDGWDVKQALTAVRARSFKPLYVIHAKAKTETMLLEQRP